MESYDSHFVSSLPCYLVVGFFCKILEIFCTIILGHIEKVKLISQWGVAWCKVTISACHFGGPQYKYCLNFKKVDFLTFIFYSSDTQVENVCYRLWRPDQLINEKNEKVQKQPYPTVATTSGGQTKSRPPILYHEK